jgi:hypothetical protein
MFFTAVAVKNAIFWEDSETLVRTDVSEESVASVIRVRKINGLGTTLTVTCN